MFTNVVYTFIVGAWVNQPTTLEESKYTPLHLACKKNEKACIEVLIYSRTFIPTSHLLTKKKRSDLVSIAQSSPTLREESGSVHRCCPGTPAPQ